MIMYTIYHILLFLAATAECPSRRARLRGRRAFLRRRRGPPMAGGALAVAEGDRGPQPRPEPQIASLDTCKIG